LAKDGFVEVNLFADGVGFDDLLELFVVVVEVEGVRIDDDYRALQVVHDLVQLVLLFEYFVHVFNELRIYLLLLLD